MPCPVFIAAGVGYCGHSASGLSVSPSADEIGNCVLFFLTVCMEAEHLFEHRNQITDVSLLSGILLRDLNLQDLVGLFQSAQKRRNRLSDLEIHRPVLDLQYNILPELTVQRHKIVVSGSRPVGLPIPPVQL